MRLTRAALIIAVAVLGGAGCSLLPGSSQLPTGGDLELAAQAAKWRSAGLDSYTFTITRSCFCPPEWSGPFEVTVVDGEPTAVTYEGRPAAQDKISNIPLTIEAVFVTLLAHDADATITATWDPVFGYPSTASVDPIPNAIDDEYAITIEDFAATE